jgi:hypothetical protein
LLLHDCVEGVSDIVIVNQISFEVIPIAEL